MESIEINGVEVMFPYKPYQIQEDFMTALITALQNKQNCLLESPTGTGKTLSLLCGSLAWLKSETERTVECVNSSVHSKNASNVWQNLLPKVLYSSRTHSQLSQACNELKKSHYKGFPAVVIGSRDQLCINEDVQRLGTIAEKNQCCRKKVATKSCQFYANHEQKLGKYLDDSVDKVFDIEDLVKFGQKSVCCPYYSARSMAKRSSVIFMPYNYILDPTIRRINSIEINNSIVIFDEGHNIEKMCEEMVSTQLKSETLAVCIKYITTVLENLQKIEDGTYDELDNDLYKDLSSENIANFKILICDFEVAINQLIKSSHCSNKNTYKPQVLFELLEKVGLTFDNCRFILETIGQIESIFMNSKSVNASTTSLLNSSFKCMAEFFERLMPLSLMNVDSYEEHKLDFIKKYKIFSEKGGTEDRNRNDVWKKSSIDSWLLNIWCLSPSIGAKSLIEFGVRNLVITSGTLSPLNSFEIEMELKFPIKLQNAHVITEKQLILMNISKSSDGEVLTSKYDNKDNMNYYRALGMTLIQLFNTIPKGVLIFFSSYTALNKSVTIWKSNREWCIWDKLNNIKPIFIELQNKHAFNDCIKKFKAKIDEPNSNGAAFLGVCRGKLSEGLDLTNDYCRCVIMTGLPFPSVADPRVVLKKQYLNELRNKQLTADGWYSLQMKRALNQSIGRVVRHKDDFGAIIFCDSRFTFLNGFSKWIEKFIVKKNMANDDYKGKLEHIQRFFAQQNTSCNVKSYPIFANKPKDIKMRFSQELVHQTKSTLTSESAIMNAFEPVKCGPHFTDKSFVKSASIFDSMRKSSQIKPNLNESTFIDEKSIYSQEIIEIDISPKKRKFHFPLKSILSPNQMLTTPTDASKLNEMTENSVFNDSNSTKKVRWSEDKLVEYKTFSNSKSDETLRNVNTQTVTIDNDVKSDSNDLSVMDKSGIFDDTKSKDETVSTASVDNDRLLETWKNIGIEIKAMFEGTNKYKQLLKSVQTFRKFKNVYHFMGSLNFIFSGVEKEKRIRLVKEISIIVPKSNRNKFLKKMTTDESESIDELVNICKQTISEKT